MKRKSAKQIVIWMSVITLLILASILIKRSIPYATSPELLSANISIDSVYSIGPAVAIYDSSTSTYYWLKSSSSMDMTPLDTLQSKKASIRFMKFLMGPLENRIFHLEVDSVVVVDQVIEQ